MQLKFDPRRPHHYIIGVGMKSLRSKDPGKLYLKYGPIYFTNKDITKVRDAKVLSEDRLFRTTETEALEINECRDIVQTIASLKIAAQANDCTLHHFSSEHKFSDDEFKTIVNGANFSKGTKKLLTDSKI